MYDGQRVDGSYDPMRKQGAILLGNGGDNSNGSQGTFYEGVMTAGYPSDGTDQLVQANIVAAKYDVQPVTLAPTPPPPPSGDSIGRVPGKFGSAVQLDGTSNQDVQLPTGIVKSLHDFTISTWVDPQSIPTWGRIFDFGTGTTDYMFLAASAGSTPRFAISVGGNAAGAGQVINAPSPLPLNQWTNIAITLSGGVGRMYVNGVQVAENDAITLTPSSLGTTTQNYIGKSQYADPLLPATIDDFQIYDRALSAGEVTALQTSPGAGDVASYKLDEANGATVVDSSGNHQDATVVTAATTPAGPSGLQTFALGSSQGTDVTYTNTTGAPVTNVKLSLTLPSAQWSSAVAGGSGGAVTIPGPVAPGDSVTRTFTVTSGPTSFNGDLTADAAWTDQGGAGESASLAEPVRDTSPIKINEFRIGSSGDATNSFIELYNAGASPVDLSGWTLTARPTQQAIYSNVRVPAGVTVNGHGFYVLGLSNSGLAAPAGAGDGTIAVRSTAGMTAGDTITIGTGSDAETRTIASVGTAASGSTTLFQPLPDGPISLPAGSTTVPVASTSGFVVGQKLQIGAGDDLEVATVTSVGKAGGQFRLAAAAAAGATNLKVTSTTNISVGDKLNLDIDSVGHGVETVTVTNVGSSGAGGTGLTLAAPLTFDHASNMPFSDWGTGIGFTPATTAAHVSNEPVQALGTGIALDRPLAQAHQVNAAVRDAAVTSAGYQGPPAPDQWFGGPAFSTSAGSLVLRDASGDVSDSLNYGLLVEPWAAEGYQLASGAGASGCKSAVPSSSGALGRSMGRYPDGADDDSNCTDFRTTANGHSDPTPGAANFAPPAAVRAAPRSRRPAASAAPSRAR